MSSGQSIFCRNFFPHIQAEAEVNESKYFHKCCARFNGLRNCKQDTKETPTLMVYTISNPAYTSKHQHASAIRRFGIETVQLQPCGLMFKQLPRDPANVNA